jgi:hypothetical protein
MRFDQAHLQLLVHGLAVLFGLLAALEGLRASAGPTWDRDPFLAPKDKADHASGTSIAAAGRSAKRAAFCGIAAGVLILISLVMRQWGG